MRAGDAAATLEQPTHTGDRRIRVEHAARGLAGGRSLVHGIVRERSGATRRGVDRGANSGIGADHQVMPDERQLGPGRVAEDPNAGIRAQRHSTGTRHERPRPSSLLDAEDDQRRSAPVWRRQQRERGLVSQPRPDLVRKVARAPDDRSQPVDDSRVRERIVRESSRHRLGLTNRRPARVGRQVDIRERVRGNDLGGAGGGRRDARPAQQDHHEDRDQRRDPGDDDRRAPAEHLASPAELPVRWPLDSVPRCSLSTTFGVVLRGRVTVDIGTFNEAFRGALCAGSPWSTERFPVRWGYKRAPGDAAASRADQTRAATRQAAARRPRPRRSLRSTKSMITGTPSSR